jgi:hypothetical protein
VDDTLKKFTGGRGLRQAVSAHLSYRLPRPSTINALERPLNKSPNNFVLPIETPGVRAPKPLHPRQQIGLGRFDYQKS